MNAEEKMQRAMVLVGGVLISAVFVVVFSLGYVAGFFFGH